MKLARPARRPPILISTPQRLGLPYFTDGLVEAENDKGEDYGEARMLQILAKSQSASAAEVMKALMASVDRFVGLARQHDDITCMVMRTL